MKSNKGTARSADVGQVHVMSPVLSVKSESKRAVLASDPLPVCVNVDDAYVKKMTLPSFDFAALSRAVVKVFYFDEHTKWSRVQYEHPKEPGSRYNLVKDADFLWCLKVLSQQSEAVELQIYMARKGKNDEEVAPSSASEATQTKVVQTPSSIHAHNVTRSRSASVDSRSSSGKDQPKGQAVEKIEKRKSGLFSSGIDRVGGAGGSSGSSGGGGGISALRRLSSSKPVSPRLSPRSSPRTSPRGESPRSPFFKKKRPSRENQKTALTESSEDDAALEKELKAALATSKVGGQNSVVAPTIERSAASSVSAKSLFDQGDTVLKKENSIERLQNAALTVAKRSVAKATSAAAATAFKASIEPIDLPSEESDDDSISNDEERAALSELKSLSGGMPVSSDAPTNRLKEPEVRKRKTRSRKSKRLNQLDEKSNASQVPPALAKASVRMAASSKMGRSLDDMVRVLRASDRQGELPAGRGLVKLKRPSLTALLSADRNQSLNRARLSKQASEEQGLEFRGESGRRPSRQDRNSMKLDDVFGPEEPFVPSPKFPGALVRRQTVSQLGPRTGGGKVKDQSITREQCIIDLRAMATGLAETFPQGDLSEFFALRDEKMHSAFALAKENKYEMKMPRQLKRFDTRMALNEDRVVSNEDVPTVVISEAFPASQNRTPVNLIPGVCIVQRSPESGTPEWDGKAELVVTDESGTLEEHDGTPVWSIVSGSLDRSLYQLVCWLGDVSNIAQRLYAVEQALALAFSFPKTCPRPAPLFSSLQSIFLRNQEASTGLGALVVSGVPQFIGIVLIVLERFSKGMKLEWNAHVKLFVDNVLSNEVSKARVYQAQREFTSGSVLEVTLAPKQNKSKKWFQRTSVGEAIDLASIDIKELADAFCIIDYENFSRIPLEDFLFRNWESQKRAGLSKIPPVFSCVKRWVFLGDWVATEIVGQPVLRHRVNVLKKMVDLASELWLRGDFHSASSVVASLQSASISRLKQTWKALPSVASKRFEVLEELMGPTRHFQLYRSEVAKRMEQRGGGARVCILPFLGLVTQELTSLGEASPDLLAPGHINFDKAIMTHKILSNLYDQVFGSVSTLPQVPPEILSFAARLSTPLSEEALYATSTKIERLAVAVDVGE